MYYKLLEENTYLDLLKESSNVDNNSVKKDVVNENPIYATQLGNKLIVALGPEHQAALVIAGAVLAAKLLQGSYRFYKDYMTKYGRQCRDFEHDSSGRERCLLRVKIKALESQAAILSNSKGECKKSKDTEKCVKYVNEKIFKIKSKITKYKLRMEKLPKSHEGR